MQLKLVYAHFREVPWLRTVLNSRHSSTTDYLSVFGELLSADVLLEAFLMISDFEIDDTHPLFIWLIVHDLIFLIFLNHLPLSPLSLHHVLRCHIELDIIELA